METGFPTYPCALALTSVCCGVNHNPSKIDGAGRLTCHARNGQSSFLTTFIRHTNGGLKTVHVIQAAMPRSPSALTYLVSHPCGWIDIVAARSHTRPKETLPDIPSNERKSLEPTDRLSAGVDDI